MTQTIHHPLARESQLTLRLWRPFLAAAFLAGSVCGFAQPACAQNLLAPDVLAEESPAKAVPVDPAAAAAAAADAALEKEILQVAGATGRDPLLVWVDRALDTNKHRTLDINGNKPWEILHGLLALREKYELRNGNRMVNAVNWISNEARFKGESWFIAAPGGGLAHPYNGTPYDFEGHVNQTLAIIAMCNIPLDHRFKTQSGEYVTMQQMVDYAKLHCSTKVETTWTLWFLTAYVDQDEQWTNIDGEPWSMEYLVKLQNGSSYQRAPCGGCHSLFALAFARNSYMKKHGQLRGVWLEADQKLQQYTAAAKQMQNTDGSFATGFFNERGYSNEFAERIKSSGHMLEWLMLTLPQSRLNERWLRQGVQTLAADLIRNSNQPITNGAVYGPLYHSIHALALYKQRADVPTTPAPVRPELAQQPQPTEPKPVNGMVKLQPPSELPANAADAAVVDNPEIKVALPPGTDRKPVPKLSLDPVPAPQVKISDAPPELRRLGSETVDDAAPVAPGPLSLPATPLAIPAAPLAPVPGAMPIFEAAKPVEPAK